MSAGNTSAKGGTNHKGKVTKKAPKASTTDSRVHSTLCKKEAPSLRCKVAKRRSATMRVRAVVMKKETANSEATTTKGVTEKITTKGATTVLRLGSPTPSSQSQIWLNQTVASSPLRTDCTTSSQYR